MLNRRKILFVHEFLAHGDGAKAATSAGYRAKDAGRSARALLSDPVIAAEIERLTKERLDRLSMTADEVMRELATVARIDVSDVFTIDGKLRALHEMPAHVRKAIASVKTSTVRVPGSPRDAPEYTEVTEVKFWPKVEALSLLANHHGLLKTRVEVSKPEDVKTAIAKGRKRVEAAKGETVPVPSDGQAAKTTTH